MVETETVERMPDWADKIIDNKLSKKADESIEAQKDAIAVAEASRIETLLRQQMEESVKQFSCAIGGVEGPVTSSLNGYTRFRTVKMPLRVVEFSFVQARILFKTHDQLSLASPFTSSDGIIRIRGEFNAEPWFEYNGRRLNTIEEVSELLLRPLFESAG
jgi:hypothetical protein